MFAGRRVLCDLARFSLCRGIFADGGQVFLRRRGPVRQLSVTPTLCARSRKPTEDEEEEEEENSEPIKFSTSKASHRTWNVDRSMGSTFERPWWKVLPVSLVGVAFLLWCIFRTESKVDEVLEKNLYEHLPGLLSDEQAEEVNRK